MKKYNIEQIKKNLSILKILKKDCAVFGLTCSCIGLVFAGVGMLEGVVASQTGLTLSLTAYLASTIAQHKLEKKEKEINATTCQNSNASTKHYFNDEDETLDK